MTAQFTNDGLTDLESIAADMVGDGLQFTGVDVDNVGAMQRVVAVVLSYVLQRLGTTTVSNRDRQESDLFCAVHGMVQAAQEEGWID